MNRKVLVCLLTAAVSLFTAEAQAGTITFNLDYAFSGFAPNSTSPFLTATFNDGANCVGGACAVNTVQLILTTSLESSSEFVTEWDFNSLLPLTSIVKTGGTANYTDPVIQPYSSNNYQADGDGLYDFEIDFASSNMGLGRFNGVGESATFLITGAGITFSTFNTLSAPGGGSGPFFTAAHVQGIDSTCSGWVSDGNGLSGTGPGVGTCGGTSVPDSGTTLGLLGLAMLGVGFLRRRIG